MLDEKNIIKIAREHGKEILQKNLNSPAIEKRFQLPKEKIKQLKDFCRAFELETQEEIGIPTEWYSLAVSLGPKVISYIKNRDWKRLESVHGSKIELSAEDLKSWGRWLLARQEVGHLLELAPLFTEESPNIEEPKKEEVTSQQYISNKRIWYNEERDTYTTYLPGVPHAIELPGETHRDLVRAYSNFDGQPSSTNELARTFQLPRNWIIKYLRVHEITHDKEPFTTEEVMSRSEEELAHEALQIRRAALYTRLERDKWKEIQKEAQKWQEYEAVTLRRLENIIRSKKKTKVTKLELPASPRKFISVITPTDFHWGKYGDVYECGEKYDRPTAKERLITSTQEVLRDVTKHGAPEKIIVGVGSDFFNADTYTGTTTQGTPQDNDGNMPDILTTGCELMTEYIDILRQVAPVELVLMAGNHDQLLSISLHLYLQAWYRNEDDVTTIKSAKSRQYIVYANNLMCFHHGDGVKKTSDLARLAAVEATESWGKCDNRMVFTGHLHYEKVEEDRGFTRYQLPSLSGEDRWHAKQGYVGNKKILAAILIDNQSGVFASIYSNSA